jgi:hypothetical protein
MRTLTAITLAAALASASGCATTGAAAGGGIERSMANRDYARYEPYLEEPIDGFTAFRHDSWQPISRNQLVLWTSNNDAYLLTVAGNCSDLPFAETVHVTTTGNEISKFDSVIVRGWRCPITEIQPIDIQRMKADRRLPRPDEEDEALVS